MSTKGHLLAACTLLGSLTDASQAIAADTEQGSNALEEIIVTAQKRSERLQDVPIAIVAVTGGTIGRAGIHTTQDLQVLVPSLNYTSIANSATAFLRGIGTDIAQPNAEAGVATYVDGVFVSFIATGIQNLMGVERVEVLKGPQGTLYGRNAVGGAINVITKSPNQTLEAGATLTAGNYSRYEGSGFVSGPLSDTLSVGLYAGGTSRSTYYDQIGSSPKAIREETVAVRGKFVWSPSDRVKFTGSVEHVGRRGFEGGAFRNIQADAVIYNPNVFDQPRIIRNYTIVADNENSSRTNQTSGALRSEVDFGNAKLLAITGYRNSNSTEVSDLDGSELPILSLHARQTSKQFSQEIQLLSAENSRIQWIVGAFLFDEQTGFFPNDIQSGVLFPSPVAVSRSEAGVKTRSYAGFAQATVPIGAANITLGGRYTVDKKHYRDALQLFLDAQGDPLGSPILYPDDEKTWHAFTPKITLDYKLGDTLLYATVSKGFKTGAYSLFSPTYRGPVNPEKLTAYEIGTKSRFANGRISFETSAYYYDFANIQVQVFDPSIDSSARLQNAATATLYGVEAALSARIVPDLTLNLAASWEHAEYDSFPDAADFLTLPGAFNASTTVDASHNRMPRTPEWALSGSLNYRHDLANGAAVEARASWYYSDGFYWDPASSLKQKPYHLVDMSAGYHLPGDHISIEAFVSNLTNAQHYSHVFYAPTAILAQDAPPRMYGMTLRFKY